MAGGIAHAPTAYQPGTEHEQRQGRNQYLKGDVRHKGAPVLPPLCLHLGKVRCGPCGVRGFVGGSHLRQDDRALPGLVRDAFRVALSGRWLIAVLRLIRTGFAITGGERSEEHTSELQSLMRISYAVFCLKKKILYLKIQYNTVRIYIDNHTTYNIP